MLVLWRDHLERNKREFPGGPMIRIWCFYCQGQGSIPGPTTKILQELPMSPGLWEETRSLPGRAKGKHGGMGIKIAVNNSINFLDSPIQSNSKEVLGTQGHESNFAKP